MAAQYCRYCSNMVCGDANYCTVREVCLTEEYIKRTNKCKDFDFNPLDALGLVHEYQPRPKKEKPKPLEYYRMEGW